MAVLGPSGEQKFEFSKIGNCRISIVLLLTSLYCAFRDMNQHRTPQLPYRCMKMSPKFQLIGISITCFSCVEICCLRVQIGFSLPSYTVIFSETLYYNILLFYCNLYILKADGKT